MKTDPDRVATPGFEPAPKREGGRPPQTFKPTSIAPSNPNSTARLRNCPHPVALSIWLHAEEATCALQRLEPNPPNPETSAHIASLLISTLRLSDLEPKLATAVLVSPSRYTPFNRKL